MVKKPVTFKDHVRRVRLFLKIVYRKHEGGRITPSCAWEVAGMAHGQIDTSWPLMEEVWRIQGRL